MIISFALHDCPEVVLTFHSKSASTWSHNECSSHSDWIGKPNWTMNVTWLSPTYFLFHLPIALDHCGQPYNSELNGMATLQTIPVLL